MLYPVLLPISNFYTKSLQPPRQVSLPSPSHSLSLSKSLSLSLSVSLSLAAAPPFLPALSPLLPLQKNAAFYVFLGFSGYSSVKLRLLGKLFENMLNIKVLFYQINARQIA